jgi:hypothetical protein
MLSGAPMTKEKPHGLTDKAKAPTAIVHIEVPRESKTRWVAQAQKEGVGLAAWISQVLDNASEPLPPKDA